MNREYDDIIVGAGIAGIVAALLKAKANRKVLLVDGSSEPGGLMKSITTNEGFTFDYGTHLLSELGIPDLDQLLFEEVRQGDWQQFDYLKSGHYVCGRLCEQSPVINAEYLEEQEYRKGLIELIQSVAHRKEKYWSLEEQLDCQFGETFSNLLMKPAVEKLFYQESRHLVENAHLLFGLARVQGFEKEAVRVLKGFRLLDDVLAFRSHLEGKTGQTRFYPTNGGIGAWVTLLINKFKAMGGELLLGAQIEKIELSGREIKGLQINSEIHDCKSVTWTVPLFGLLKLFPAQTDVPKLPLHFLDSYLIHLIVDKEPVTDLHYYCNYDSKYRHFRTTLYSNMQGHGDDNGYRLTVEVFSEPNSPDSIPTAEQILDELVSCNVCAVGSKVVYSNVEVLKGSFPVPTHDFQKVQGAQLNEVKRLVDNVELFGKARGDIFFMNDVIVDVYEHTSR